MNGHKRSHTHGAARSGCWVRPKTFVFLDRTTGSKRFEVKAAPDGSLPLDQATSVLAMQCVVRGQSPDDFRVMVSVGDSLMDGLVTRTKRLIQACMATVLPIRISQRQQEVLRGILQNLSNKEIAAKLNLAERTVKFHVSALLQKFHVTGRVSLMQKAADLLSAESSSGVSAPSQLPTQQDQNPSAASSDLRPKLLRLTASERRTRAL